MIGSLVFGPFLPSVDTRNAERLVHRLNSIKVCTFRAWAVRKKSLFIPNALSVLWPMREYERWRGGFFTLPSLTCTQSAITSSIDASLSIVINWSVLSRQSLITWDARRLDHWSGSLYFKKYFERYDRREITAVREVLADSLQFRYSLAQSDRRNIA